MKTATITTILILLASTVSSQSFCHHIDCFYMSLPDSIENTIYLDSLFDYSLITDNPGRITPNSFNERYQWQKNFRVYYYNIKDQLYLTDTILISEGFLLNGKRNDFWTRYYYSYHKKNKPYYNTIYVGNKFYIDDIEMFDFCRFYPRNDILIKVDHDPIAASFFYPVQIMDFNNKMDTTVNLIINCGLDSLNKIQCTGTTEDSIQIFKVEGIYLHEELNWVSTKLRRKVLYGHID